jgi:type I restriction enzyme S subunit
MAWKKVPLTEVVNLIRGTEPGSASYCEPDQGVRFLRVGDVSGKVDHPVFTNSSKLSLVSEEDILLALDGSPGYVARGFTGAISSGIRKLKPLKENILSHGWLFYILQSPDIQNTIKAHTRGITIAHASSAIAHIKIPLPSFTEQERIVRLLDEANSMRRLRKKADKCMSVFIPALFQELFGDPVRNEMGWPRKKVREVCNEMYRYPTFYGFTYADKGVPVVRIGNILQNGLLDSKLEDYVYISEEVSIRYPRTVLRNHDSVMAVRGDGSTGKRIGLLDSINLVGANMSPNLIRFNANSEIVDPIYFYYWITSNSGQDLINSCITRTAKKTITAKDIGNISIITPPIPLQGKFSKAVMEARHLQDYQAMSTENIEALYKCMLSRAFAGEL